MTADRNELPELPMGATLATRTTQSEIYRRGNVENGWKSLITVDHA